MPVRELAGLGVLEPLDPADAPLVERVLHEARVFPRLQHERRVRRAARGRARLLEPQVHRPAHGVGAVVRAAVRRVR